MSDNRILRLVKGDSRLNSIYRELISESGSFGAQEWVPLFQTRTEEDTIYNLAILYRKLRDGALSNRANNERGGFSDPADDFGINIDDQFTRADVELIAEFFTRLQVVDGRLMQSIEVVATRVTATSQYRRASGARRDVQLPSDPLVPSGGADLYGSMSFGEESEAIPMDPYPGDAGDPNGPGDNADPTVADDIRTVLSGLGITVETLVALVRLLMRLFRGGDSAFNMFMNTAAMLRQIPVAELERRTRPRSSRFFPW